MGCVTFSLTGSPFISADWFLLSDPLGRGTICLSPVSYIPSPRGPVQVARQSVSWWCSRAAYRLICCRCTQTRSIYEHLGHKSVKFKRHKGQLQSSSFVRAQVKKKSGTRPGLLEGFRSRPFFLVVSWQEKDSSMAMDRSFLSQLPGQSLTDRLYKMSLFTPLLTKMYWVHLNYLSSPVASNTNIMSIKAQIYNQNCND